MCEEEFQDSLEGTPVDSMSIKLVYCALLLFWLVVANVSL